MTYCSPGGADQEVLFNGLLLSLYFAEDPVFEFGVLLREAPHLAKLTHVPLLQDHIHEHGGVDLF